MPGAILKSKSDMIEAKVEVQWTVSKSDDITIVRWQSNNVVNVAFVRMGNIDKVKRWSKKDKAYIDIDCPE